MKTKLLVLTLVAVFSNMFAQAPKKFSYQAVVRNSSGAILSSGSSIAFRISILDGSTSGTVLYQERITHTINNNHGIANLEIGGGSLISGSWPTEAQWATGSKFLKVEIDIFGASSYVDVSNTQLISVAYAQHANGATLAEKANKLDSLAKINLTQLLPAGATVGQIIKWNGSKWVPQSDSVNTGDVTGITVGTGLTGGGTSGNINIDVSSGTALWNANKLQGKDVSTSNPTNGQLLRWNGTAWEPSDETTMTPGTGISISGTTINSTWTASGNHIYNNNTSNVGIGTTNPTSTLSVNEKFKVAGNNGTLTFTDAASSIQFPNPVSTNNASIYQFVSGTQNSDKYVLSHSPSYKTWGLMYHDSADRYEFQGGGPAYTALSINLANSNVAIGKRTTSDRFDVHNSTFSSISTISSGSNTGFARQRFWANGGEMFLEKYAAGSSGTFAGVSTPNLGVLNNPNGSLYLHGNDSVLFGTGTNRHMTLNKNGYLGIGTNSPVSKLHLHEKTYNYVGAYFSTDQDSGYTMTQYSTPYATTQLGTIDKGYSNWIAGSNIAGGGFLYSSKMTVTTDDSIIFATGNTRRMAVTKAGTVDINASVRIGSGTPGTNKVLTSSDNLGNATWKDVKSLPGTIASSGSFGGSNGSTFPAGSSNLWEFFGPTTSITVNGNQRVIIYASTAIGRNTTGTASFSMDVGYMNTSGTTVLNCSSGNYQYVTYNFPNSQRTSTSFVGSFKPTAGTYSIGTVIRNSSAGQVGFFNNNDYSNITYQIINE